MSRRRPAPADVPDADRRVFAQPRITAPKPSRAVCRVALPGCEIVATTSARVGTFSGTPRNVIACAACAEALTRKEQPR